MVQKCYDYGASPCCALPASSRPGLGWPSHATKREENPADPGCAGLSGHFTHQRVSNHDPFLFAGHPLPDESLLDEHSQLLYQR